MTRAGSGPFTTVSRILPLFRLVFGAVGVLSPRRLGRWYGLSGSAEGSLDIACRYASIRAVGLGLGQVAASPERRHDWDRIALLVDCLDTLAVVHAGLRGRISTRSALVMLSGTLTGVVLGGLAALEER